jgi:cysteinyl-tRNA synthetase
MTLEEFRREMELYRQGVDAEATALKDSYLALERLHALYRRFEPEERAMAGQVFAEWALSDDEAKRFDALALIDDFRILAATPALRQLADRLEVSTEPGAPYEWQKVNRIIGELTHRSSGAGEP